MSTLSSTTLRRYVQAYVLQLADVTPQANLQYHFARWEGHFQTEGPRPDGTATVRFQRSEHLKEALDYFGGGLRGLFRLVHTRPPSKGAASDQLACCKPSCCLWPGTTLLELVTADPQAEGGTLLSQAAHTWGARHAGPSS